MKTFKWLQYFGVAVLLTVYAALSSGLRTERHVLPGRPVSIERTYRGEQCVVAEMSENGRRTRGFTLNGKTLMVETDTDGDGFLEEFMIFDPETGDFECFTRTTNNLVQPVSSARLQELRQKKLAADKALGDALERLTPRTIPAGP